MAIAVTVNYVSNDDDAFYIFGTLVFSGSYTAGGDTLDLTNQPSIPASLQPVQLYIAGQSGFNYNWIPGGALSNGKVKIFGQQPTSATTGVIALSELAAAAYPAGITGDTIQFEAIFKKLL